MSSRHQTLCRSQQKLLEPQMLEKSLAKFFLKTKQTLGEQGQVAERGQG